MPKTCGEVFNPLGQPPSDTYVDRKEYTKQLTDSLNFPGPSIIVISGPSGIGKTVLVNHILAERSDKQIKLKGGSIKGLEDFEDKLFPGQHKIKGQIDIKALFGIIDVTISGQSDPQLGSAPQLISTYGKLFSRKQLVLVIDNFHHIPSASRLSILRFLRDLSENAQEKGLGLKIIILFVPTKESRSGSGEWRELSARATYISLSLWTPEELKQIVARQVPYTVGAAAYGRGLTNMSQESFGLPSIMQALCLRYCQDYLKGGIEKGSLIGIGDNERIRLTYRMVANGLWQLGNEAIYDDLTDELDSNDSSSFLIKGNARGNINQVLWYALTSTIFSANENFTFGERIDITLAQIVNRVEQILETKYNEIEKIIRDCLQNMSAKANERYNQMLGTKRDFADTGADDPIFDYNRNVLSIYSPAFLFALRHSEEHRKRLIR